MYHFREEIHTRGSWTCAEPIETGEFERRRNADLTRLYNEPVWGRRTRSILKPKRSEWTARDMALWEGEGEVDNSASSG